MWLLIADSSWSDSVLNSRTLGIAVWIGLAALSITLLILMRTRWGQVKPLSKCVVLSVCAHLLLFMYAYGTHLFTDHPPLGRDDVIQISFVTAGPSPEDADQQRESKPWGEFLPEDVVEPDKADARRAKAEDNQVTRDTAGDEWVDSQRVLPEDEMPVGEPERPTVQRPEHQLPSPTRSRVQAVAMQTPASRYKVEPRPTVPATPAPRRVAATPTPPLPRDSAQHSAEPHLPTELVDIGSRMQQLTDVSARSETADAIPGQLDQLAQSANRGMSPIDSSGNASDRSNPMDLVMDPMVAIPSLSRASSASIAEGPALMEQVVAHAPRRLGDGQPMPEPYRLRNMPQRQAVAARWGGSVEAEAAVAAALAWLAANQESDGRWDPDHWGSGNERKVAGHDRGGAGTNADTGITGLAILAFLANGQNHLEGTYRKNVQRGLEFLLRSQAVNGNLSGQARLYASMYCHGMALLALSEAYALTGDVRIKPYVEHAVRFTVAAQDPASGGWRYQPGDPGDMSQFGWQVMALKSAHMAGIPIPDRTRDGMLQFLSRCAQGRHQGLAGYQPARPASRAMTAEALVCRFFLDLKPAPPQLDEATQFLLGELPQSGKPNLYYWYYGTLAMFQVQGQAWEQWNQAMQRQLLRLQRADGDLAGSWDPDTVWGSYGGRIYSTAIAALSLEVYYRYLPLTALLHSPPENAER